MISVHSSPLGKLGTQDTGGMSVYIRELARQLGLRGHRIDIFTRSGDGYASGEVFRMSENVRLIPIQMGLAANAPKTALYPHLSGFFHEMDRFRRSEAISYDLIHSHYWLSGKVGLKAQREWGVPLVTTFHTLGAVKNRICGIASEPPVRLAVERGLVAASDRVLVTCQREKDNLVHLHGAEPFQVAVAPCGVDLDAFHPLDRTVARARIGASAGEKLILYVGRFAPEKGLDRLLQAAARLKHLPELRWMVVGGDGEQDPAYRRMRALGLDLGVAERVAFRGRVDQSLLPWFYSAADLLALPSSYESFGMVALEALACGTPVAATPVGAMEDLLTPSGNGRLAKDFQPSSLADAVAGVLKDHSVGGLHTPETIRRSVLNYEWSRAAGEVLNVYRECRAKIGVKIPAATVELQTETGRTTCCGCGVCTPA